MLLTAARAAQERTMLQTAWIHRRSVFDDPGGGTGSTSTFLGPFRCRVGSSLLQRGEELIGGRLQGRLPFTITLPALTDVREEDEINVDGAVVNGAFVGGTTYVVAGIYAPTTFETAREVLCSKK